MLKLDQFDYDLPEEMIAQKPADPRDESRLLLINRAKNKAKNPLSHHHFYDLPDLLREGDVLVRNNTKVIKARLFGTKSTGGKVEILLNKPVGYSRDGETWECLTKPGLKPGTEVIFGDSGLSAVCVDSQNATLYTRLLRFNRSGVNFLKTINKIGTTPLPPYIKNTDDPSKIEQLYQTLYAKSEGSVAAPTAGLHFTPRVEKDLALKKIEIIDLTLHVGLGTFLPVKTQNITDHKMHGEWFNLTPEIAQKINDAKSSNRRIISVGTTTTRVLESCAVCDEKAKNYRLTPNSGETDIFIYPGYKFKIIDGLLTNFHLPKSTLLMLISAITVAPNTQEKFTNFKNTLTGKAYQTAIKNNYRFFSFGDSMLIL